MKYRIFGAFLIVVGISIFMTILYKNSHKSQQPIVYSPAQMLNSLWNRYKQNYWDSESGRTLDHQQNDITTSEGQSYTMLRAVWQDDKPTYDKTWQWTQNNMQHSTSSLSSWLYGKKDNGTWGILDIKGGQNSASDADTDIALSLLLAAGRWQDSHYLQQAKTLISDIWNMDVVEINGVPYLAANDLEKNSSTKSIIVNPSYLSPYAYRLFAQVDPAHNWKGLVNSSYDVITKASASNLDREQSSGLPPDWIMIDRSNGEIIPPKANDLTTNYSYDALRTPWRIAIDWQWNKEPRAQELLNHFSFLSTAWQSNHMLYSSYAHDGQKQTTYETPAMYGGSIGYYIVANPNLASEVYKQKLENLYNPDILDWKNSLSYYDNNWAWFGLALYNNKIINSFEKVPSNATSNPTLSN